MVGECIPDFFVFFSLHFVYGRFCVVFPGLISVEGFVGNSSFWLLFVLFSILFCFFSGSSGREYILEMRCMKAASLCSMRWFEKKLMVVSVVVVFLYMSISRFVCLRVFVNSIKPQVYKHA